MADHYIVNEFLKTKQLIDKYLKSYKFNLAWQVIYDFIWHDLADWYLEISKLSTNKKLLNYLLNNSLKLVHPFAPFTSETLYQELYSPNKFLINETWKIGKLPIQKQKIEQFNNIKNITIQVRSLIEQKYIKQVDLYFEDEQYLSNEVINLLKYLIKINNIYQGKPSVRSLHLTQNNLTYWLVADIQILKKQYDKLNTQINDQLKLKQVLEKRLNNKDYLKNAPNQLILESKQQLNNIEKNIYSLEEGLQKIKKAV